MRGVVLVCEVMGVGEGCYGEIMSELPLRKAFDHVDGIYHGLCGIFNINVGS